MKNLLIMLLLMLAATQAGLAQNAAKNKEACKAFYEALNARDLSRVKPLIADDFIDHSLPPDLAQQTGLRGYALFEAGLNEFFKGFPDMKITPIRYVAEDDFVMIYISMSGSHTGEFAGIPPTGKTFNLYDVDIVRFDQQGKAVEHWAVQDGAAMMMQLGVH